MTSVATALAKVLGASTAATSLVLQRLELKGHISRHPDPFDGRKVVVVPAKKSGRAAYQFADPIIHDMNQLILVMKHSERKTVTKFINGLLEFYKRENSVLKS